MQRLMKTFLMAVSGIPLAAMLLLHAVPGSAQEGGDAPISGDVPAVLQQRAAHVC